MKFVLIFLLFLNHSFSDELEKLVKNAYFSNDGKKFHDLSTLTSEGDLDKEFYIKLVFDKDKLKNKKYYLRGRHSFDALISTTHNPIYKENGELVYIIDGNIDDTLLLHLRKTKNVDTYIVFSINTEEEFSFIQKYEKLFFGLCSGIIFCAFLYNFVLFLFNREKSFLYYSLMQISFLIYLLSLVLTFDIFYYLYEYININDISGSIGILFAMQFSRHFLDIKKYSPILDKLILIFFFVYLFDTLFLIFFKDVFLDDLLPTTVVLSILVLTSLFTYFKGNKITLFYIFGWSIVLVAVSIVEFELVDIKEWYLLFAAISIESLIFSFALAYKMRQLSKKNNYQEQMLIHQNKLSSMGEMINNIAHQYRQPLTHLGYIIMNINSAYEHNELDKKYLDKKTKEANDQLEFLSNTIDTFRDFYKPSKEKTPFYISTSVEKAVGIVKVILDKEGIELVSSLDRNIQILGFENEYSQIVLNLLTNAKDALISNKIDKPRIEVIMSKVNDKILLSIEDNGLGIKKENEEKIFEPYFTTKEKSSGIGLYMSSMIIQEHFSGTLTLDSNASGARFIIKT